MSHFDMRYEKLASLEEFLSQVESMLLSPDRRFPVSYPSSAISPWAGDALACANRSLLSKISGCANLYAIFTGACDDDELSLRYLGKTTRQLARQRITNHLFRKHDKTGSKLSNIIAHTCCGGTVAIGWVGVSPESLRNYIEEELILRHPEADWNRENGGGIKRIARIREMPLSGADYEV